MIATTRLDACGCEVGLVDGERICRAACTDHGGQLNDWACPCDALECISPLPRRALPAWFLQYRLAKALGHAPRKANASAGGTGGPAGADAARHLPLTPRGRQTAATRP